MISTQVDAQLQRWVSAQLLFWEGQRLTASGCDDYFRRFNDSGDHTFVFIIRDQSVSLMPKPNHYAVEELTSDRNEPLARANLYRRFFEEVIRAHCPDLECRVAMSMDDRPPTTAFPIFAFQKPRGSHAILLPDIDAISQDFYTNERDTVFYEDKINKAVFVGSTTGTTHTLNSVRALSNERLNLGVFFRNKPDVIFNLPNIVQCDSPETAGAIRALGFGSGVLSWQQQLSYRFLISADGNGATCSRVAIALKSNSVLLKFFSENLLYYFDGLEPYRDYIPINSPDEVRAIVRAELRTPSLCEIVAKGGATFFETFLARASTHRYTTLLLQRYAAMFAQRNEPKVGGGKCIAHLSGRGDIVFDLNGWIGEAGSRNAIEGFEIDFSSGLENGLLICKFLIEPGGSWITTSNGGFVGSRGRSTPLIGLAFEVAKESRERFDCEYRCAFVDGHISNVCRDGQTCEFEGHPLEAFQICVSVILNKRSRGISDHNNSNIQS